MRLLKAAIFLQAIVTLALALLALIIALMPRRYTIQLRHRLAEWVLWQWIVSSKLSSIAHHWLWSEGNGRT